MFDTMFQIAKTKANKKSNNNKNHAYIKAENFHLYSHDRSWKISN